MFFGLPLSTLEPTLKRKIVHQDTSPMKEDSKIKSKIARQPGDQGTAMALPASSASGFGSAISSDIKLIAQRMISGERRTDDSSDSLGRAAFRVCEKLRPPLSSLIGVVGFRSLFYRALTLAKGEVPWLAGLQVAADGALQFSSEMQGQLDGDDAARGGTALIAQLHGLLITFIGAALTLRLVHSVWPEAAVLKSDSVKNSHETPA